MPTCTRNRGAFTFSVFPTVILGVFGKIAISVICVFYFYHSLDNVNKDKIMQIALIAFPRTHSLYGPSERTLICC